MSLPEPVSVAVAAGRAVVPADQNKRPKVRWKRWTEQAQTEAEVAMLGHGSLWAVVTGTLAGFVVLDFDGPDGLATMNTLGLSPHVRTAAGAHVYVRHPGHPVRSSAKAFPQYPGLDIKGESSLAFFSGRSKKGDYEQLQWPPEPVELAPELAAGLFPHPQEYNRAKAGTYEGVGVGTVEAVRYLGSACENIRRAAPSSSNAVLNRQAFTIGGLVASGQLDESGALDALYAAADARGCGDPVLVVEASFRSGAAKPWTFPVHENDDWVDAYEAREMAKRTPPPEPVDFPIHVLPPVVRALVAEGSESLSVPPDYIGAAVLPVLGAGIGSYVSVELKRGWLERASLYVSLVGGPGAKKTPAINVATRPIVDAQWSLLDQADNDRAAQDLDDDDLVEIVEQRLIVDDATVEAFIGVLAANPRGVLLQSDELAGWIGGFGQYKGGLGRDRQHWLSIWSQRPIVVDRVKNRGRAQRCRQPFANVLGGIQPDVLAGFGRGASDGLVERLLLAQGHPVRSRWTDAEVSTATSRAYAELWNELRDGNGQDEQVPTTAAARRMFASWVDELGYMTPPDGLAGNWAKMDAQAARIALILSRAAGDRAVDSTAVEGGVALARYFMGQAVLAARFTSDNPSERESAKRTSVLEQFLEEHPGCTRSFVTKFGPGRWSRSARTLDPILADLGRHDLIGPR